MDDRQRFFKYGHERHSRLATGENHQPYCELTGNLRFGWKIDSERHYNVSETEKDETSIEGTFADCHSSSHDVKDRPTHLNMFSNDFF